MSYTYSKPTELYTITADVVDKIRATSAINGIAQEGINYRYTSDNSLAENDYIYIITDSETFENIRVLEADENSFLIDKEYIGAVSYKAMAPYFMDEKQIKAANILTGKEKQKLKYPLFLLERPYTDNRDNQMIGYSVDFNLHILIDTEAEYDSNDRVDINFDPIIYPLYVDFINELTKHRDILEHNPNKINHTKGDLMYIGGNPFPDKMDGATIAFTDLEVRKGHSTCVPTSPKFYEFDLSSDENGIAESSVGGEGVYNLIEGTDVYICAKANAGFKFKQWLINNVSILTDPYGFKMNQFKKVIAEFEEALIKQLTMTLIGIGETDPVSPGVYQKDQDIPVPISATETDVLYYFEKFIETVGGVSTEIFTPNFNTLMSNNTDITAYFLEYLQYIFGTAPIKIGDNYFWDDLTSNASNAQIRKSQIIKFNGISSFINFPTYFINGGDRIYIKTKFTYNGNQSTIFSAGGQRTTEKGFILRISGDKVVFNLSNGSAWSIGACNDIILVNGNVYEIELDWDGSSNSPTTFKINGTDCIFSSGFNHPWIGDSFTNIKIGIFPDEIAIPSDLYMMHFDLDTTYHLNLPFKESGGTEIINRTPGLQNGVATSINEADFWSEKSDESEPLENYPYTLFQQIADPTKFIRAIYDTAGNPTKTSIAGYNKIAEISANVVSNTGATYLFPDVAELKAIYPASWFVGDGATYQEIIDFTDPKVEKTQDVNTVSLMKTQQ
ncbi:MAG: InlB B-repeat-containing protein [Candidatus Hodarchaeales archaeon]|jgi:hypothetical protein